MGIAMATSKIAAISRSLLPCSAVLAAAVFVSTIHAHAQQLQSPTVRRLFSFERSEELQSIQVSHASITRVRQFPTDGHYALQVDFEPVERPQIEFLLATPLEPIGDPFGALALDVTNPSNEPISFSIEVQDAKRCHHSSSDEIGIWAPTNGSYALPINSPAPLRWACAGSLLSQAFVSWPRITMPIDIEHVTKFRLFLIKPAGPRTLADRQCSAGAWRYLRQDCR